MTYLSDETEFKTLKDEIASLFKKRSIPFHDDVGISRIEYNGKMVAFVRLDTSSYDTLDGFKKQVADDFKKNGISFADSWEGLSIDELAKKRSDAFAKDLKEQVKSINTEYGNIVSDVGSLS